MELSLFSISYAGLWGQQSLTIADFVARAAELGFPSVMLVGKRPHLSPLDYRDEQVANLHAMMAEYGVRCSVIAGYTDFSDSAAAEVPYIEMQILYAERLARLARSLGANVIRLFTAYERDGQATLAVWNRVVDALREICDRAADHHVMVAVQNHHDLAVHTDCLLELLSDVDRPNCKLGFDAWSVALRGEDLYDAARRAAPQTMITTNADYVRLPRFQYRPELVNYEPIEPVAVRAVPFGDGFIDFEAFFCGLKDGGFDGVANYEMCSPLRGGGASENLDRCATAYLQWMRLHGFASAN